MGAVNMSGGNTTYYNIIAGKLVTRLTEDEYNSLKEAGVPCRTRTKKDGSKAYEKIFDGIVGTIVSYDQKPNEKFKTVDVQLTLEDAGERHVIQFGYDSRIHTMLLQRMPNIDPIRPIFFGVFEGSKQDGSKVTMMYLKYDSPTGEKIENAFPKDGDHDLPDLKKRTKAGITTWDNTDQMDYFENNVIKPFKDKIISDVGNTTNTATSQPTAQNVDESDDLPF